MSNSIKDKYLADPARYAEEAYDSLQQRLLTIEYKYAKGVPKFENLFAFMASAHENLGLLAYFAHGDMTAFKQHWYLATKLWLHASRHLPNKDYYMSGGEDHFTLEWSFIHPLVSDNQALINEAAALETPVLLMYRDNPKTIEFAFHIAQLVIRGDYEAAQAKIAIGAKKAGSKMKQAYANGNDFYSLLMKGDKAGLEDSLMNDLRNLKKNTFFTVSEFVYPIITLRTKLCWHKGIPVEIEHPMVPMAWMPIQPLPQYDDIYDFLSPNWQPPDQGFMARLSRKLQKSFPEIDACMERIRQVDRCS
ncbi:hypothetical protein DFR40_1831 [Azonexus fungiphilus]|uniref:Immunity protein 49 of polymorphic toxin system n=1 Tax=Azonexus fungiphilus TaxID=146940 RepID=A0A495WAV6_9RHOO|nr:hypothetical protein [Azonexus fungiphilus]RKT58802.1 hypothetical protein DFR40_1831 [Azonexus fungiphilus]